MKQNTGFQLPSRTCDAIAISRRLLRILIVALCFNLAQPLAAVAQTSAPPLPPAAQEVLDKGIIAARVPDYLLAIRYFDEARKLAPQAPVVFLNMGLAESRIPGRELRAMAWFGAYLSAYPEAPNAAVVKEQITVLEVKAQSDISRLLRTLQDAAKQTSDYRDENLRFVATLWAESGDVDAAVKVTDLILNLLYKRRAQRDIVRFHVLAGMPGQNSDALKALLSECGDCRAMLDEAKTQTKSDVVNAQDGRTFEWLYTLNGGCRSRADMVCSGKGLLNAEPFLDLAGYLKSLPRSNDPQQMFASLHGTAKEIATAKNVLDRMLRQQV